MSIHKNLFNEMQEFDIEKKPLSPYQKTKQQNNYRKSIDKNVSCKTCIYKLESHHNGKTYYKCKIIGESFSSATDIRLKNVCNRWK
jgi:hypothetical protein